jgi:hypothetical protein
MAAWASRARARNVLLRGKPRTYAPLFTRASAPAPQHTIRSATRVLLRPLHMFNFSCFVRYTSCRRCCRPCARCLRGPAMKGGNQAFASQAC